MATTAEKTKISREECEQYESLNETRLSLERQARALKKQIDELDEKLLAYVRENGGKLRSVNKFGFLLSIQLKNGTPSWKEEFIRELGLEAAEKVAAAAAERKKESLTVSRA